MPWPMHVASETFEASSSSYGFIGSDPRLDRPRAMSRQACCLLRAAFPLLPGAHAAFILAAMTY